MLPAATRRTRHFAAAACTFLVLGGPTTPAQEAEPKKDQDATRPNASAPKAAPEPQAITAESELARFQGSWSLLSMEGNGISLPLFGVDEEARRDFALFRGDVWLKRDDETGAFEPWCKVRLDPAKSPKQIDLVFPKETLPGIYKFQKRTKTLCICFDDKDHKNKKRPESFSTSLLSGKALLVFDDQEAEPKAGPEIAEKPAEEVTAASELARLQGSWSLRSMEGNGISVPTFDLDQEARRHFALFRGDVWLKRDDETDEFKPWCKVRLDPTKSPKQIDLVFPDGTLPGIYKFQKRTKTLCICFDDKDHKNKKRPESFSTSLLSGKALLVFDDQEAEPAR